MNGQQPMQGQQQQPMQQQQQDPMAMIQNNPAIMAKLQEMPPEQRQEVMKQLFQDYQGQEGIIDEQMAMADELRGGETPQGIQTGTGFVASNPFSHAAKAVNTGLGFYQQKQALDAKKALSEARTSGVTSIADMLRTPQRPEYTRGT